METEKPTYCKNCKTDFKGNYCSNCGQQNQLKRIDKTYILDEVSSVLNFDKGFFFTIRELLIKPGITIRKFISFERNRLVKPIVFIIICSLIYTIFQQIFHFEDGYVGYSSGYNSVTNQMFTWISQNYGYSNIIMALFIAVWIKIFFNKQKYNYFEILILLCFVMGIAMLLFAVFGFFQSLIDLAIIDKGFFIGIAYIIWAIGNFFKGKRWLNYIKSFFAYFLGFLTFTIAVILTGTLLEAIIN